MPKSFGLLRAVVGISVLGLVGCGGEVATLEYVSITPPLPKIGEVATVQFKLTDYRGMPLAGKDVTFKLDTANAGVSLTPLSANSLKGSGIVETQLVASNRVASVRVIATAGGKEVSSPALSFAGSAANGRQFTFQCGKISGDGSGGVHAIGAYDQSRYLIAGVKLNCVAHVADRNGDGLNGALVSFVTEAGTIGPSESSVSDVVGNAEILYKTSLPMPKEVAPATFVWNPTNDETHTGEYLVPLWMEPYRWTTNPIGTFDVGIPALVLTNLQEPRRPDPIRRRPDTGQPYQNNPRDNLVSMIAITQGEEGFTDSNNNGIFDTEEAFDDLAEPFVDADDNGTWDADEKFIDVNNDGKWNGKNGKWDQNTTLWVAERIIWTGIPNGEDAVLSATNPVPCIRGVKGVGGPIEVSCNGFAEVDYLIADPWWNGLARNNEGDGCSSGSTDVVDVIGGDTGAAFTYSNVTRFNFLLKDKLDRKPTPMLSPPQPTCNVPPGNACTPSGPDCWNFKVQVVCKFTASQVEGHIVALADIIEGRIWKNTPP